MMLLFSSFYCPSLFFHFLNILNVDISVPIQSLSCHAIVLIVYPWLLWSAPSITCFPHDVFNNRLPHKFSVTGQFHTETSNLLVLKQEVQSFSAMATGIVQTRYRVSGKGTLKKQGGFLANKS